MISKIKLLGKKRLVSFANNQTKELWQEFVPKRNMIKNTVETTFYSVEIYDNPNFFEQFDPSNTFEKWAAVQVREYSTIPTGMQKLTIPAGLYAVFLYQGRANEATQFYQYIYGNWIPNSEYELDNRPHFARMGEKYKNDDPRSEEEIYVPVVKLSNPNS